MSKVWTTKSSELPFNMSTMSQADQERLLDYFEASSDEEIFDVRRQENRTQLPGILPSDNEIDSDPIYLSTTESDEDLTNSRVSNCTKAVKNGFKSICLSRLTKLRVTIEPAIFLYFMGVSLTMPLTQQLLYYIISYRMNLTLTQVSMENSSQCLINASDPEYILQQEVQATSSIWMMAFVTASVVPAFFTTIFLGAYSDRTGRKLGLMVPVIGVMLRALWSAVVLAAKWPVASLLLGVLFDGISGGIGTMTMSCFAYISDVTTPSQRSFRIVVIEIAIALGVTLSQVLSGYFIVYIGFEYAFIVVLSLYVVILVYITVLPETVTKDPNATFLTVQHFKATYKLYANGDKRRTLKLLVVMILLFLTCTAEFGAGDVLTFTLLNAPFCWNSIYIGYFFAASCAVRSFGSISATKLLSPYLNDQNFVTVACVSALLYSLMLATATNSIQVYLAPVGGILSLLSMPMIRAFASKLVLPQEQGTLFGSIALMQLLAVLIGNLSFNAIYSVTLTLFHGFVFYVISGILVVAIITSVILHRIAKLDGRPMENPSINFSE